MLEKKQAQLLASKCTSLLLGSQPVQLNCLPFTEKFKKNSAAIKVNETKITSRKAFIVNLFALNCEKKSKNDKITLFY